MYPNLFRLPEWVPLLGGEPITSFGFFVFLSFLTGGILLNREMKRIGWNPEIAWDVVFAAVVGGILGAKIYYILLHTPELRADPMGTIFQRAGLVWYGGFIGGIAAIYWQVHRNKLSMARVLDLLAPILGLAHGIGRMGCFMVGDDYGIPTGMWLGVRFPQGTPPTSVRVMQEQFGIQVDPALIEQYGNVIPVHPTQLYEVILLSTIFFILWRIREHKHATGWLFSLWMVLAGTERFLIEFIRAKSDRYLGIFTTSQIASVVLIVLGAYLMRRLCEKREAPEEGEAVPA